MRCLVCGEIIEKARSWEHIRSVHLQPLGLTQEKVLEHAQKIAHPLEVRTAYVTCVNLRENIIYFSLDNVELLIAFATEHGGIPWMDIVEWQLLHEKGHLACRELYQPPIPFRPFILHNVEDYYINRYLIPEQYWRVCIMNAKCSTMIRNIMPLPDKLRDGYYYCTLATFWAYEAVTLEDINFLKPSEAIFSQLISRFFKKIKEVKDLPLAINDIDDAFKRLYPPKGVSWDNWQILNTGTDFQGIITN